MVRRREPADDAQPHQGEGHAVADSPAGLLGDGTRPVVEPVRRREPTSWTAVLNELGYGPYKLVSIPKYKQALRVAAGALRESGRPVGLVMWKGRHAWVMSGFTSDADPRAGDDFDVTGVRVLDPLYPHGSSVWGASPKPNSLLTPAKLGKQFVFREPRRVNLGVPPGYLYPARHLTAETGRGISGRSAGQQGRSRR